MTRMGKAMGMDKPHSAGPVEGKQLSIGEGFEAISFKHDLFGGQMDPLVMVDHYTMTGPTFGAHPHAGMSAVSVLFEDSVGQFNNRDSLGNDINLEPGDLYWLKAGSGAVHDEKPLPGAKIHGLQMFVNLPAANRCGCHRSTLPDNKRTGRWRPVLADPCGYCSSGCNRP